MPALARPVSDERDALLHFLAQHRDAIITAAFGLTEEQARSTPSASANSIAALIQHGAATERYWIDLMLRLESVVPDDDDPQRFNVGPDVTVADLIADYRRCGEETEEIVAGLDDLELAVPLPAAPWFPPDGVVSARWVLFHLIQETCRHAGHADIIRETIDGANAFMLIAEAEAALV